MRRTSTLAGSIATLVLIATAPIVARAQLEDGGFDPGPFQEDTGAILPDDDSGFGSLLDAGGIDAAGPTDADPGPRLPGGEPIPQPFLADTGGCSCGYPGAGRAPAIGALVVALALAIRRRRDGTPRQKTKRGGRSLPARGAGHPAT